MIRLHAQKWNQRDREYTMLILTEEDILNEVEYRGAGFELVILPAKFKDVSNTYLDSIILVATARCGEIMYV